MGLFDNGVDTPLEDMFDLDRDGNLNAAESGLMMEFLENDGVFPGTEGTVDEDEEDE